VYYLLRQLLLLFYLFSSSILLANDIENKFIAAGLVDINTIDSSIKVDLVNANPTKNFFEADFYDGLGKAYLRKPIAKMLSKAQNILKKEHPSFSLQVLDAARPRAISRAMYKKMKGTRFEKYVANPKKGSMHNYGIAVDITIVDGKGNELDMGPTPFYKSHAQIYWQYFLKKVGFKLSSQQQENQNLLKQVMLKAGFYPLSHEWWHFNGMKKADARRTYSIIE
jgi:zinc D-Ala-D-Ala dipeptidase